LHAYLDKHAEYDDSESQRLQEELLLIYQNYVHNNPSRLALFLAIVRTLNPAIRGSGRLLQWWDKLSVAVINKLGEEKGLATEAKNTVLGILVYDEDEEGELLNDAITTSSTIAENLLEVWLNKSTSASIEFDDDARFVENQVQMILLAFGRRRPKDFLTTMNKFFVKKECRILVLSLVCEFIRHQPPHLYQLLQTPLFDNLLKCLQVDTSTRVISLAMTALVMFLPHIPSSLGPHLPALFNIYSRMLFWDKERRATTGMLLDEELENSEKEPPRPSDQWDKLSYLLESDDETVPELLHYFTFLYGLYPLNFMSYIRKPQRYLRHANFSGAEELDVEPTEIRQRSEPFRQVHLLHPNCFMMTIESELTDNNRWMGSEAADVVAECMALYSPGEEGNPLASRSRDPGRKLDINTDIPEQPLVEDTETSIHSQHAGWHNTQPTAISSPDGHQTSGLHRRESQTSQSVPSVLDSPSLRPTDRLDSPTLPPHMLGSTPQNPLHEMLASPKSTRDSIHQALTNDSVVSLSLSQNNNDNSPHVDAYLQSLAREPAPRSPSIRTKDASSDLKLAYLHREIQLLRNDLNFERYLKQQHLSHIGQLRRKQLREARVEAETQNLINLNRRLKGKFEEVKNNLQRMKKETEKSKLHSRKWETDLTSKVKMLREEQKKWGQEREDLEKELENMRGDNTNLRTMVLAAEKRELEATQRMQSIESNLDELERLRVEVDKLTMTLRTYEAGETGALQAKENEEAALRKVAVLKMQLRARDEDLLKMQSGFENKVRDMRRGAGETLSDKRRGKENAEKFDNFLDSALNVAKQRMLEVQKAHNRLLRRYTELEDKYLELKAANDEDWMGDEPLLSGSGDKTPRPSSALQSDGFLTSRDIGQGMGEDVQDELRRRNLGVWEPEATSSVEPSSHVARATDLDASSVQSSSSSQSITEVGSLAGGGFDTLHLFSSGKGSTDGESSTDAPGNLKLKIKPQSDARVFGRGKTLIPVCVKILCSHLRVGGVQNNGKKGKEKKDKGKEKEHSNAADNKKEKKNLIIRGMRGMPPGFDF
jgi:solute carrier family 25 (mitochondrial carrier protein), member 16